MSTVLEEYFSAVRASDIFDYGVPIRFRTQDFLERTDDDPEVDWIITNPPFKVALDFTLRAIEITSVGVAMLVRTTWLESVGRYESLFEKNPPTIFAPFVERVPMVKGCWDPTASSATAYAWFVWIKGGGSTTLKLIPPGCRKSLTLPGDVERFGKKTEAPLLA